MDGKTNPVSLYSRKGYCSLNVQYIVDDRKKVLWEIFNNKGASNGSTYFKKSDAYQTLTDILHILYEDEFFFLGDSAYFIQSFDIPPYDAPMPKSQEDDFNCF